MSTSEQHNASAERVDQFLQHLLEIIPALTSMPPELRTHLMGQLEGVHPRVSLSLVAQPPAIYRMASMMHSENKPTMGEISRALSLPLATVSRIVTMLEQQGFARRLPDAEDGRVVRVGLTDAGRRVYEAMVDHGMRSAHRVLDRLTVEEQIILITLLSKVAANLKDGA